MARRTYQNFIFDLYGTLVDIHTEEDRPEVWQGLARFYADHGAAYGPEELRAAYRRETETRLRGREGIRRDSHEAFPEIRLEEVFLALFRDRKVDAGRELALAAGRCFRALTTDYLRLYDDALELLRALRRRGGRIYLLSNAQRIFTEGEMAVLGLTPLFDAVYLSSAYGCRKPDRRFFDMLIIGEGLRREESIMIGNDGLCDVAGGKGAGLDTLYIRSNLSPQEDWPAADYTLPEMDLARLAQLLLDMM